MAFTLNELRSHLAEVDEELKQIDEEHAGDKLPDDVRNRWDDLTVERAETLARIKDTEERAQYLETLAASPNNMRHIEGGVERGPAIRVTQDPFDLSTIRASAADPDAMGRELNERARRVVDEARFPHERVNREDAQQHVSRILENDESSAAARRILATGSPTYIRAFNKALLERPLTSEEARALSTAGSGGGYAVPFTLDPTVIPSSDGVVNPLRQIARVITIVGETWKGVSSSGITVSRGTEGAPVDPTAPTLVQPVITPTSVKAEIQFSVEIGEDWGGLDAEIAQMLSDAKDVEEADMFTNGLGPDTAGEEPAGVVQTLSSDSYVLSGSVSTFGPEDVYTLTTELPPRFRAKASFLANLNIYNTIRQFATDNGPNLWAQLGADTPAVLLGKQAHEASEMDGVIANAAKVLLYGDFNNYAIVDRIGMNVELDPHVRDTNGKWTGQRALLAWWRNSAAVLVDNAFRLLVIEQS